jgi:environmental stress-induced protein Ves
MPAITSSADMVETLQAQLGNVAAQISTAQATIASVILSGAGVSYVIAGSKGSETISWTQYLAQLTTQVTALIESQNLLLTQLQNLQPYCVKQRQRIGGLGFRRWW